MKIVIDIPEVFIEHWEMDRFKDSLRRMKADAEFCELLSENYEFEAELCEMLITAFAEAKEVPPHGRLGDLDRLEQMFADIDNAPYSGFDGTEPFYSAEDAAQIIRLAPTIIEAEE